MNIPISLTDLLVYCEGVIQKPTAQLMQKYAKEDCQAIHIRKAKLQHWERIGIFLQNVT